MRVVDPNAVYEKGTKGDEALDDLEQLVYALKELEVSIAMEGWLGFFTGSRAYLYEDVRRCLEISEDVRSLAIVNSFSDCVAGQGGALDTDAVEEWAEREPAAARSAQVTWGEPFRAARADRWSHLERYLGTHDVTLREAPPNEAVSAFAARLVAGIESRPGSPTIIANEPLEDDELNTLFSASWPSHVPRAFRPVLARSLVYLSARVDRRLVGFVNVATDGGEHAFLLDSTVVPELRRRGIGQALVQRAVAESRARGARWLHVDYAPEHEPFYRSVGFRPTAAGLIRIEPLTANGEG